MTRKSTIVSLKLAFTLLLFFWVLRNLSFASIKQHFSAANIAFLVVACVVVCINVPLAGGRWSFILHRIRLQTKVDRGFFVVATYIAQFFGQVLPSAIGNDVVRSWFAYRAGVPLELVFISIFLDRAAALLGLMLVVVLALPQSLRSIGVNANLGLITLIGVIVIGLVAVLLFGPSLLRVAETRWAHLRTLADVAQPVRQLVLSFAGVVVIVVSALLHFNIVISVYLSAYALAIPLDFKAAFVVMPVVILLAAAPISIAGWGARETAMMVGFGFFNVSPSNAALLGLVLGVNVLISSIPGGILWVLYRRDSNASNASL